MSYQLILQTNPIVPFSTGIGFGKSHWMNYIVAINTNIISIEIYVFANTQDESSFYANELKRHIEENPNKTNHRVDDISIGILSPIYDSESSAFMTKMIMLAGNLMVGGSTQTGSCQSMFDFSCEDNTIYIGVI